MNLEVQGIHSVRWLLRGDAVKRLCKVLGATFVLRHEKEHDMYEVVTSYKFQFCLLADILGDMNVLNRSFQKRQVGVTEVAKTVESVTNDLAHSYPRHQGRLRWNWQRVAAEVHDASLKKRRPAQSVVFPADERKRKGKEPEEEEAGPSELMQEEEEYAESDDDGDERVLDPEIEESPPRDYSDEDDNPFLSGGEEEGEETYHIDKPLH
ncbi:unnamed protein product [Closterium sp. Naga37s-1]|nr:unnamed protein product [Closterium sp. Naga37s-1]